MVGVTFPASARIPNPALLEQLHIASMTVVLQGPSKGEHILDGDAR